MITDLIPNYDIIMLVKWEEVVWGWGEGRIRAKFSFSIFKKSIHNLKKLKNQELSLLVYYEKYSLYTRRNS